MLMFYNFHIFIFKLKTHRPSLFIIIQYPAEIADPSSMQDACHKYRVVARLLSWTGQTKRKGMKACPLPPLPPPTKNAKI